MIEAISSVEADKAVQSIDMTLSIAPKNEINDVLFNQLLQVNESVKTAESYLNKLATGETVEVHEAMIALEQSQMKLSLMVKVRDKLIESYQEIIRMPV